MILMKGDDFMELVQTSGNLDRYVSKIKIKIDNIATNFFDIGYYLWEVNHFKYYLENGYKNVYEFSEAELNFKRSSTNNFISLVDKYADFSDGNYPKMWLADKYKSYGYSHLVEMLSLAPQDRNKITPSMSIKEIRNIKKEILSPKKNEVIEVIEVVEKNEVVEESLLIEEDNSLSINISDFLLERFNLLKSLVKSEKKNKSENYFEYLGALHEVELLNDAFTHGFKMSNDFGGSLDD